MNDQPTPTARIGLVAALVLIIGGVAAAVAVIVSNDEPQQIAVSPAAVTDADADADIDGDAEAQTENPAPTAQPTGDRSADEPAEASAPAGEAIAEPALFETDMAVACVGDDWEPSAEELEASRADAEGLAAVLTAAGIDHTVETDTHGFMWVEYDYSDGIAQSVADSYYRALYPDEWVEGPFEELPAEELERIREENAGLIAALEAAGIAFEVVTEEGGYEWVEWDYEDPAAQEVVDAYFSELYPMEPLPAEELERIREENAGLIAALEAAGIAFEVVTEEGGYEWVEWDYEDPAAQEVVDAYFSELYPMEPLPAEELERIREENAGLIAALEAAGIAFEVVTEEGGYEWVEWDYEDPAAQEVVDAYFSELYGDEWLGEDCYGEGEEWIPSDEDLAAANEEVAAMTAALDEAGVAYTVEEDDNGWRWVEYDYEDPAAMEALDALWMAQSAEFAAEIAADLDRLAEAFEAAGIAYEREGHDECETIVFDTSDPAALAAVASIA